MSNLLKADTSAGDAFATKSFSALTDWYVEFDIVIPAATLAAIAADEFTGYFIALGATLGSHDDGLFLTADHADGTTDTFAGGQCNAWTLAASAVPDNPNGAVTPDVHHTIKVSHVSGTTTWKLDGTTIFSFAQSLSLASLAVGGQFANNVAGEVYYVAAVKVGTTDGGSDIFADDFSSGDLSAWDSTTGSASVVGDSFASVGSGVTIKIYDLGTTELADISAIALERTLHREKNGPRTFTVQVPAGHDLVTAIADDTYRVLRRGNRKLLVWEDDEIIFHGRIWTVERSGGENEILATIKATDPWAELGYASNDQAGRPIRGSTVAGASGDPFGGYDGNFINPKFSSSVTGQDAISGPDLILQILTNTQHPDFNGTPPGEGPLPIALTGTFDLDCPPAVDLSCEDKPDWPTMIGDFIQQLVLTDVVDVDMVPVEPGTGVNLAGDPDPYIMVELTAVSKLGTDLSGTVHFDYWTGDHNAKACRHVEDFSTILNHLRDLLGPRIDQSHWRADINIGSTGTTEDGSASAALYGGPPGAAHPGRFMQVQEYDSLGDEASNRPLYLALWNAEMTNRVEPRDLLYITPADGAKGLFTAPQDFDVGDEVEINVGSAFGITLAEKQRVYGYDKTWSREGVASLSQLVTSADIGGGG